MKATIITQTETGKNLFLNSVLPVQVNVQDSINFQDDIANELFYEEIKKQGFSLVIDGEVDVYNGIIQSSELTIDDVNIELWRKEERIELTETEQEIILKNIHFEETNQLREIFRGFGEAHSELLFS